MLLARRAAARAPLSVSARAAKQQTAYICVDCGVRCFLDHGLALCRGCGLRAELEDGSAKPARDPACQLLVLQARAAMCAQGAHASSHLRWSQTSHRPLSFPSHCGPNPPHNTAPTRPVQYIYDGSEGPFEKLPSSYRCPVCSAPKRRFKPYAGTGRNDAKSMNARYERMQSEGGSKGGGKVDGGAFLAAGVAAAAALAGLYFFLSSQYN